MHVLQNKVVDAARIVFLVNQGNGVWYRLNDVVVVGRSVGWGGRCSLDGELLLRSGINRGWFLVLFVVGVGDAAQKSILVAKIGTPDHTARLVGGRGCVVR